MVIGYVLKPIFATAPASLSKNTSCSSSSGQTWPENNFSLCQPKSAWNTLYILCSPSEIKKLCTKKYLLLPQLPQKTLLASKVVKRGLNIFILLCQSKSVKHSVFLNKRKGFVFGTTYAVSSCPPPRPDPDPPAPRTNFTNIFYYGSKTIECFLKLQKIIF